MGEDANSWLRRTKFSHTVCHRLDTPNLAAVNSSTTERNPKLKVLPEIASVYPQKSSPTRQRSASPTPETLLPDTFKEAKSEKKRFSTPNPRRKEPERGFLGRSFNVTSKSSSKASLNISLLKRLDKHGPKDSSWMKFFDQRGGRVRAVVEANEYMVDLSSLFLGPRFAHGAHSRLYHGMYKDEHVAVKIIRLPDDADGIVGLRARLENQFNGEVTLLSRLHHQNIIRFIAACRDPPVFCIITEYISEGSLRAYLHKLEHKSLPLDKLLAIALDIARGMEYIHLQGIIHRDLKPENVLITEGFHMKIVDFGIACEEAHCDSLTDDPGTFRWMAPEMIKRKSYGRKVDVYSFGLILWELVAGTIPYEDMTPIQAAFAVVNKKTRPIMPTDCPAALQALIEACWSSNPEKRPDFWLVVKSLEQFQALFAQHGTLNLVPNLLACQAHKKGLLHWIQKLGPAVHPGGPVVPKPKFA